MADAAELDVVVRAHAEGLEALRDVMDAIRDIRNAQLELAAAQSTVAASGAAAAASTAALAAASGGGIPVLSGLGAAIGWVSANLTTLATVAVVAAVAALSMLVIYLAGVVVLLGAFAAGVATVAVVLGGAFLILGSVAGAVILLADNLSKAGLAADPLLKLEQHFKALALALGQQAYPMAVQMIDAFDKMLPRIQAVGTQILTWFGGQLPAILSIATATVNILLDAWQRLSVVLEGFSNRAIAMSPALLGMFRMMLDVGVSAVAGLLDNLLKLSGWFIERLPTLGPIVAQIMGGMGSVIQELGKKAGEVVDWFIKNWPMISKAAAEVWGLVAPILGEFLKKAGELVDWFVQNWPKIKEQAIQTWKAIKEGWDFVQPAIEKAIELFKQLLPVWEYVKRHGDQVRDILTAIGIVAGILVVAAIVLIGTVLLLVAAFLALHDWLTKVSKAIGDLFWWLGQVAPAMAAAAAGLSPFIGGLQTIVNLIGDAIGALARLAGIHVAPPPIPALPAGVPQGGSGMLSSFQSGGTVPGPLGAPTLAVVHGGENIIPAGGSRAGSGGQTITNNVYVQTGADPWEIAKEIAWQLKFA